MTLQSSFFLQAAQESKFQYEPEPIIPFDQHVDKMVTALPDMVQIFTFLQDQGLVNQSFHQFLQTRLVCDDLENNDEKDANFGEVLGQAQDVVAENTRDVFIQTLDIAINNHKKLNEFDSLIFLYVMQHKDDFMYGMVNLWLFEWSKTTSNDDWNPLHRAAQFNNPEITRMLINANVDINIQNKRGWAPLHWVSRKNNKEVARILIETGADLNIQNKNKRTPLHIAAANNNQEVTHILITAGANLNIQDNGKNTPLHWAVNQKLIDIVRMLITAGANLNIQTEYGETPLIIAAQNDDEILVPMLIIVGGNVNIQNNHGRTAEQEAQFHNNNKVSAIFSEIKQDARAMAIFENQLKKDWR